jgi:hypothetical protein
MSYDPSDYAVEPRRIVAAWAVCAALLVAALGANIGHANSDRGGVRTTCWHRTMGEPWSAS